MKNPLEILSGAVFVGDRAGNGGNGKAIERIVELVAPGSRILYFGRAQLRVLRALHDRVCDVVLVEPHGAGP